MDLLIALGRTLGFSLTSGVNLYATVAILGLAVRNHWVSLPPQYEVFGSDWIIGGALVLYVVEFVRTHAPQVILGMALELILMGTSSRPLAKVYPPEPL